MKIYIHHLYKKTLFYTICHNTYDREFNLFNDEGVIKCKYKDNDIEFIFKNEISFEEDGYHILDFYSAYNDSKIGEVKRDTTFMEREHQQILQTFIKLLNGCPSQQKWIITYFKTEKILHSIDTINFNVSSKIEEIESLLSQLNNHHIVNDNLFLDKNISNIFPNFHFSFTNTFYHWNHFLNMRWYYEFKPIFDKLNFDYDLAYSVRNHKGFRVDLINELKLLNIDRLYLQTSDTLGNNRWFQKFGKNVSNEILCSSIYGNNDFDDISYLENIINGLDLFFRVMPKAKMQILCESWSGNNQDFKSQYLSEKTLGFILSGIPFISTNDYPLIMIQEILEVPNHPFFNESKKFRANSKLFANFVNDFMKNFEKNYKLCKEWSDIVFQKFINKIETENSLLDLILSGKLERISNKKNMM